MKEFFVDVDGRRGEEDHDRAFDVIFLGFHAALFVFAGRGNGEFTFGLQELEGVARLFRAFFFDDGEDLVFQVGLAEVVEALTGHSRVFDAFFLGYHRQHGFHEARFSGGAGGLDDNGQRFIEFARDCREVTGELVRGLAHDAAFFKVLEDALQEVWAFEELEGGFSFVERDVDWLGNRFEFGADALFLECFELKEQLSEVAFDEVGLQPDFRGGCGDKVVAVFGAVKVEQVEVVFFWRPRMR